MRADHSSRFKKVRFLFITLPCIGETVLRGTEFQMKDNEQTGLFRDTALLASLVSVFSRPTMEILVDNSGTQELDLLSRFKIYETRNGRARVEMFNLIIMSEVFQEWFMDEFQCNLPLPLVKKTGAEPQNFVAPTSTVELIAPFLPRYDVAPVPVGTDNAAPVEENIVPAQRDPVLTLEQRVLALERTVANLRLALEPGNLTP